MCYSIPFDPVMFYSRKPTNEPARVHLVEANEEKKLYGTGKYTLPVPRSNYRVSFSIAWQRLAEIIE